MTIDEAIKILEFETHNYPQKGTDKGVDAIKLGIEALKLCKNFRDNSQTWGYMPLPGETK